MLPFTSHPSELNALARITRRFGDQAIGGHSSQEHCSRYKVQCEPLSMRYSPARLG